MLFIFKISKIETISKEGRRVMKFTVNQEIEEWVEKQEPWVVKILIRIFEEKKIDNDFLDEIMDSLINDTIFENQKLNIDRFNLNGISDKILLLSINETKNVNALYDKTPLVFSQENPTIIYGLNGAGKSGYVRVLKGFTNSPHKEKILGNVFSTNSEIPRAKVEFSVNDENNVIQKSFEGIDKEDKILPVSIFDTYVSEGYITQNNVASYQPILLTYFTKLIQVMDFIRQNIQEKIKTIECEELLTPKNYMGIDIKYVKGIKEVPEVLYTSYDKNDEVRLNKLNIFFQETDTRNRKKQLDAIIISCNSLLEFLDKCSTFYTEERIDSFIKLSEKLKFQKNIQDKLKKSFLSTTKDIDDAIVESKEWQLLWSYARKFSILQENQCNCSLCGQKLTGEVAKRYQTIDSYVNSEINQDIIQTEINIKQCVTLPFVLKSVEDFISDIKRVDFENDTADKILSVYRSIFDQISDLKKAKKNDITQIFSIIDLVKDKKKVTIEELELLNLSSNVDEVEKLKTEYIELKIKEYYKENSHTIIQNNLKIQRKNKLKISEKKTNTISVTMFMKKLTELLLTESFIERFNRELEELTSGKIKVAIKKGKANKGQVSLRLVLIANSKEVITPKEVLSEGEQRIVSMAAFLADNTISGINNPLIFDDPISSLDVDYERKVVKRLAELSKKRQVIIFTHRLSLLKLFQTEADDTEVVEIVSRNDKKGIATKSRVDHQEIVTALNTLVNDRINEIKKKDIHTEAYTDAIWKICQDFRKLAEKSIEDLLIGKIVTRYNQEIKSSQVKKLAFITEDDCDIIDRIMTKYSFYEHSHSDETPINEPEIDEIEKDIIDFAKWAKERKKRLNSHKLF